MATRIATLPMYDRPELREATDRLWSFLRDRLRSAGIEDVPEVLERDRDHAVGWGDDRLLFSQACGYDVHLRFPGRLTPVGAPRYRVEGCEGTSYCSAILVRADEAARGIAELRGRTAAYNEPTSHSGRLALAVMAAEHAHRGRFFDRLVATGSHERSAEAVAGEVADVAALDCTSWALVRRSRPDLDQALRILTFSPACPAPPYVVGPQVEPRTRRVLGDALAAIAGAEELAAVRASLLLDGVSPIDAGAYAACGALAERSRALGYDLLADTSDG